MSQLQLVRVLVVEDNDSLRHGLEQGLAQRFEEVRSVGDVAGACELLREFRPDLLVLDVELPDGNAVDIMRAALEGDSVPLAIAMSGAASADQSFALAQLGVRAYLPKPVGLAEIEAVIEQVSSSPPDVEPIVRSAVGQQPIHELEHEVRTTMLREALSRVKGSRRGAARILGVSRQLVQHMLRRHDVD